MFAPEIKTTSPTLHSFLEESQQKIVDAVSIEPPKELSDDPQKPYGEISAAEFREATRDAIQACVRTIEEGLVAGLDMIRLYGKLENLITTQSQELAKRAGRSNFEELGLARVNDFFSHFTTGLGENMPYLEAGQELLQWIRQRPLSTEKPFRIENHGNVTFLAQLYTPEVLSAKKKSLLEKVIKKETYSTADLVVLNIIDSCYSLEATCREYEKLGPHAQIKKDLSFIPSSMNKAFYVGRVTLKTALGDQVNLSTYLVPLELEGNTYVPGKSLAVLHPHPHFVFMIHNQLIYCFKNIVQWDPRQPESLNDLIVEFSSTFGKAFFNGVLSLWCLEVLIRSFYHLHGFKLIEGGGLPLSMRALITPYQEDLKSHFTPWVRPFNVIPKSFPGTGHKYLEASLINLQRIFKNCIDQRVELHNNCLDQLKSRFMQTKKTRDKHKNQQLSTPTSIQFKSTSSYHKLLKALILKKEWDFHSLQLSYWQNMQQCLSTEIDEQKCLELAEALDRCRSHNIKAHIGSSVSCQLSYLNKEAKYYVLHCRQIQGSPPFIGGEQFNSLKKETAKMLSNQGIIFPVEHITLEPIADISNMSPQELDHVREKARCEHILYSGHMIYFERYITPEGERAFVCHPLTVVLNNVFTLIKVYASGHPKGFFPYISIFDKVQELFKGMLDEELPTVAKLTNMLSALKTKLELLPKADPAPLKPPSNPPAGTSSVELDQLLYHPPQPTLRKPKHVNLEPEDDEKGKEVLKAPALPPVLPTPAVMHTLKDREDYELFLTIMGVGRGEVTWNQLLKCFAALNFSISPKGGSIYKFKYEKTSILVQEEGMTEHFVRGSKNFHEPHVKGKYTDRTPLPHSMLERFKELLLKVGMNTETVKLQNRK